MSHTTTRHAPRFSPDSDRSRLRNWLTRDIKATDIIIAIAAIVAALGFTVTSPNARTTKLESRVTRSEQRIDTLARAIEFTNYLQCVQLRRTDATMLPPGCAPILEKQSRP